LFIKNKIINFDSSFKGKEEEEAAEVEAAIKDVYKQASIP
jgi:hypothetical protein